MSRIANMQAAGWKTDGLPAHMVRSLPLTCVVTVEQVGMDPKTHHVQMERNGKLLTQSDRLPSWRLRRDGDPD